MKRVLSLCVLAVLTMIYSNANALQILNFEDIQGMSYFSGTSIPDTSKLADQYLLTSGIRFSSDSPYVAVVNIGNDMSTSGINGLGGATQDGILTYNASTPITASFYLPNNPQQAGVTDFVSVRGDNWGSGLYLVTLEGYDVAGNLIGSSTSYDFGGETLTISVQGIHSIKFIGTSDYYGVALDDLIFNDVTPIPTPEPSSILLTALGLCTLGLWKRKQVKQ